MNCTGIAGKVFAIFVFLQSLQAAKLIKAKQQAETDKHLFIVKFLYHVKIKKVRDFIQIISKT